jgi:hypothetical protein
VKFVTTTNLTIQNNEYIMNDIDYSVLLLDDCRCQWRTSLAKFGQVCPSLAIVLSLSSAVC